MRSEFYRTPAEVAERSGLINEGFVFDKVRVNDPEYQKEEKALVQKYRAMRKPVPPEAAFELIKPFQPLHWETGRPVDPESPVKQFPSALRRFIAGALGARFGKDTSIRVLFYTAVGSLVDTAFGADAVIEIIFEGKTFCFIRLDITQQQRGRDKEKTRKELLGDNMIVVYGEVPDVHENKAAFDAYVADAGQRVVEKFEAVRLTPIHGARR